MSEFSSYQNLIYDIRDEIDDVEILKDITDEMIQLYILQGCQRIASRLPVRQKTVLRLTTEQTQYSFADTTTPVTGTGTVGVGVNKTVTGVTAVGTGTITTDQTDVTGVGTAFLSELSIGKMIVVGTEKVMVMTITSNTVCTISTSFDTDLSASAFSYSTTKFTKEINVGSSIIVGGVTRIVDTITDGYNLTVTQAYTASQSAQTFTINTKVTEIPTKFYSFEPKADRLQDTISRPVNIVSNEELLRYRQQDWGTNGYATYSRPYWASVWNDSSGRYLEIYPPIEEDKQITLYGYIQINPRTYSSLALSTDIPLSSEHETAIKEFAKYMIYKKKKMKEDAGEALSMFDSMARETLVNLPVTKRIQITKT